MAHGSLRIQQRLLERRQHAILAAILAFVLILGTIIPVILSLRQAYAAPVNPTITGVFQNSGPTTGGNTVIVSGSNFGGGQTFTQIAEGGSHTCGVSNGKAYCWGVNGAGQFGNNTTSGSSVPTPVLTTGVLNGKTVTMVAAGGSHSCALTTEVKVYCWGDNGAGQLGNNSTTQSSVPVAVDMSGALSGKTVTDVSTGAAFTCALTTEGKVYCWGVGSSGQMGNGASTQSLVPVAVTTTGVLNGKTIVDLGTGDNHACAATSDGLAYCWGLGTNGQLGNNSTSISNVPVAVTSSGVLSGKTVTQITGGGSHTCATASGAAYCWGLGTNGQLGNNGTTSSSVPVTVTASTGLLSGKTVTQVNAGASHTCAVASGVAYCWGLNTNSQVGDASTTQRNIQVAVSTTGGNAILTGKTVANIYSGSSQTCALTTDNTATCWGLGTNGQLGNNASATSNVPVMVSMTSLPNLLPTVSFGGTSATSVTYLSTTALSVYVPARPAGIVGVTITNPDGTTGTLANAYTYVSTAPTLNSLTLSSGTNFGGNRLKALGTNIGTFSTNQVTTGYNHTCTLSATNKIFCVGTNASGQLGNNTTTDASTPVAVDTSGALSGKTIKQISGGGSYTCALATDGSAYCWGANSLGQLGDNTTTQRNTPVAVSAGGLVFTQISTGSAQTCATTVDAKAYCWGNNGNGQLGDNTTTQRNIPTAVLTSSGVLSGKPVASVSAGYGHSCAVTIEGKIYCWGLNTYGMIGNGTSNNSLSAPTATTPTGVLSGRTVVAVSAGYFHTCAVDSTGISYCWGLNANGRLGDNSTTQRTAPVAVYTTAGPLSGGKKVTQISAGGEHTCAITADNIVSCWGNNAEGRLGDGTTTQKLIPTAIIASGLLNGKVENSISVGQYHSCTTTSETYLYCWGLNTNGQLGSGTATSATQAVEQAVIQPTSSVGPNAARFVYALGRTAAILTTPPPAASGLTNVTITNADGQSSTLVNSYNYVSDDAAPTISSISPNSGATAGGTSVTVNGTNLVNNLNTVGITAGMEYGNPTGHSCSIMNNGTSYCWGLNNKGQLGNGNSDTTAAYAVPYPLDTYGSPPHFVQIGAGANYSCSLSHNFLVFCWGWNAFGQMGNGTVNDINSQAVPVTMSGAIGNKDVTVLSVGRTHVCALTADNAAYCWGENGDGKLGNGSTTASSSPVAVSGGLKFMSISAGPDQTCAVTIDYKTYCWGTGTSGQLGTASAANSTTPVAVDTTGILAGKRIVQTSTASKASCGLDTNGAVYCWGNNASSQLGNGSTTNSNTAVATTMSGQVATSIAGGFNFSCMTTTTGVPRCWGDNVSGSQGTGNTTTSTTPTAMVTSGALGGKFISEIAPGDRHTCMRATDGAVACTGLNTHGQLGNNLGGDSTSPVVTRNYSLPKAVQFDTAYAGGFAGSSAAITMITPAHAAGAVDVKLTRADYQTATTTNGYTYVAPLPGAPTGLNTTPAESAVILNWTAPSSDGGSAITDYKIEYSSDSGSTWSTFAHTASTATSRSVTGLSAGTTYTFRVSAVTAAGTGPPSATVTGTPIFITASTSSSVAIGVLPSTAARISSMSQDVTVSTNAPNGYNLSLSMNSTGRNLLNGTNQIVPSSGTRAAPFTGLDTNTWGYRVDGLAGFGAGPTTTETNVTASGFSWAGVPASSVPDSIRSASTPGSNQITKVWYAMNADITRPTGVYTNTVLYTAVTNP